MVKLSCVGGRSLTLETKGFILHFGFGHHQVGDVLSVLLSTFDVEEDVEGSWGVLLGWWCHLDEAAVGLNVHHLLIGRTLGIPTAVFLPLFSILQQFKTPKHFLRLWQTEARPVPSGLPSWVRPRWLARQVGT